MGRAKGISSERIAKRLLEGKGFTIISTSYRIMEGNEKVAEVDIIADDQKGDRYAIEVKSGRGDINSIRQTYANAKLCGYKPLLVCKGFSDDAARRAAKKLGVFTLKFSEYYLLLEPEELESIVKKCVEEVFETHGFFPYTIEVDNNVRSVLKAISSSDNFDDAAEQLNLNRTQLGEKIDELTKRGVLPRRSLSYQDLKRCCSSIIARSEILLKLEKIEKKLK